MITLFVLLPTLIFFGIPTLISIIGIYFSNSQPTKAHPKPTDEEMRLQAGKEGENAAVEVIKRVLGPGDFLCRNVPIMFNKSKSEMDTVVFNQYGIFIVEVKNYTGQLSGNINDYEWREVKFDRQGKIKDEKMVKNPIAQVNRQTQILKNCLTSLNFPAVVRGYVIMVQGGCPVQSEQVLYTYDSLWKALHTPQAQMLDANAIQYLLGLFPTAIAAPFPQGMITTLGQKRTPTYSTQSTPNARPIIISTDPNPGTAVACR